MEILDMLGGGLRLAIFLVLFVAVAWFIWRKTQPRRAYETRAKARSWLGRAWDSVVRFWSR